MADGNILCLGCVGAIFVFIALFSAFRAFKDWRKYRASEHWLQTTGQITMSNVTAHRGTKSTNYRTYILYTYQVQGQSYQGSQFSFDADGIEYGSKKDAEKVTARYPVGSQPAIYYDPGNPSQAVLERKYDSTAAILSVIFFVVGTGMIVYSWITFP